MPDPILNINKLDTGSLQTIGIIDVSSYGVGFTINQPTIEITVPGFSSKILTFTPNSLQVYNSSTLGITCESCGNIDLPDGIYTFKYSVTPVYQFYVQKTFLRVDQLLQKFDSVFLKLEFMNSDGKITKENFLLLDTVETYIEGAIAAANNCLNKLAMQLYHKAETLIQEYEKRNKRI